MVWTQNGRTTDFVDMLINCQRLWIWKIR